MASMVLDSPPLPPAGWPDALLPPLSLLEEQDKKEWLILNQAGTKRRFQEAPGYPDALRPGSSIAAQICADVSECAGHLRQVHGKAPQLAIIEVGNHDYGDLLEDLNSVAAPLEPNQSPRGPTSSYAQLKANLAECCGIRTRLIRFSEDVQQAELLWTINQLMQEWAVHGILVELPLPSHIDEHKVLSAVGMEKDVNGFCPGNRLAQPSVAAAVLEILLQSDVPLGGKEAVVLGRSRTVGTPVALMLQKHDCTVTICHSQTRNVEEHVRRADVVVACVGKPGFVKGSWLKKGAVVVDVGLNSVSLATNGDDKLTRRRIVGDVCFEEAKEVPSLVTPVAGGVGHVALAVTLRNVVNLARGSMGLAKVERGPPMFLGAELEAKDRAALRASPDQLHFPDLGMRVPQLMLPRKGVDLTKWTVIACDQYTSQPNYWKDVEEFVGDAPSTLNMIFPEVYLGQGPDADEQYIRQIHKKMQEYERGAVMEACQPGFMLINRKTPVVSSRNGLLVELDLDHYSYDPGAQSLIRATEATIEARLPPRVAIRRKATVEMPHILVLIDDPDETVIEPLVKERDRYEKLYEFDLMKGAGSLTGHLVTSRAAIEGAVKGLRKLSDPELFKSRYGAKNSDGVILFGVGDGNHSLAAAKWYWEELKKKGASMEHPARFALVELMNVHDPGLQFEPIHRLVFNVAPEELLEDARQFFKGLGLAVEIRRGDKLPLHSTADAHELRFRWGTNSHAVLVVKQPSWVLAAATLTSWLDPFLARHKQVTVDYVHGQEVINEKCAACDRTVGILLPGMDKNDLLRTVVREGVLPRKTFSMGEADEKRFYLEARRIVPETTFYRADFFRQATEPGADA